MTTGLSPHMQRKFRFWDGYMVRVSEQHENEAIAGKQGEVVSKLPNGMVLVSVTTLHVIPECNLTRETREGQ